MAAVQLFMGQPASAEGVPRTSPAVPAVQAELGPRLAPEQSREVLVVLAASSLQDVLPVVARAWLAAGGGPVRFSFDATSRLAPQILAGAPADVFISADDVWMRWLEERSGVDSASIRPVTTNQLVFVVPRGTSDPPGDPRAIARSDLARIALAGENVPAGRYARAALESVGAWRTVELRVVRGGSVRGTLEWVARAEADGGIVYRTDALAEDRVTLAFTFEGEDYPAPTYLGAVTTRTEFREAAEAFLDFMSGAEALALLAASGFGPAGEGAMAAQTPSFESDASSALDPWSAVRLSLIVAFSAVLLGLVPAVAMGWLLARRDFLGKSFVSMIVMAPLVVPPVVTGFLLLSVLGRESALGGMLAAVGLPIPFTLLGATLAALVVGFLCTSWRSGLFSIRWTGVSRRSLGRLACRRRRRSGAFLCRWLCPASRPGPSSRSHELWGSLGRPWCSLETWRAKRARSRSRSTRCSSRPPARVPPGSW